MFCSIVLCSATSEMLPEMQHKTDAAFDLKCAEDFRLDNKVCLIPTGTKIKLPVGYHADVRPRSGIASKLGTLLQIANTPGTIDSSYRGEIKIIVNVIFHRDVEKMFPRFVIPKGTRIAQLLISKNVTPVRSICRFFNPKFKLIVSPDVYDHFETQYSSDRGSNGFGSSGLS
ncbi:MAG: hypothetical protein QXP36_09235 [Conexivisphaerales archaeon]